MAVYDLSRAVWRKSSRSGQNGACVEVAAVPTLGGRGALIAIRDSKDRDGIKLIFGRGSWAGFLRKAKAGNFDLV